jgi:hypothetical protein
LFLGAGCGREEPPARPEGGTEIQAVTPQEFFDRYVKLEHAFDPAAANLYSDDAVIRNTRTYPTGQQRTMTTPAPKYKSLIRKVMPLAKVRGDTNSYKDITYTKEGDRVRIKATRHSNLKNYDSPISILISQDDNGHWLIVEEISQSQP